MKTYQPKVLNLQRIEKYIDKRYYSFNLAIGGFIVNGFVYNADNGSIKSPLDYNKRRVVRAFGQQIRRLRELVEAEVVKRESEGLKTPVIEVAYRALPVDPNIKFKRIPAEEAIS